MQRRGIGQADGQIGGGRVVEDAERRGGDRQAAGAEPIERRVEGRADVVGEPIDEARR